MKRSFVPILRWAVAGAFFLGLALPMQTAYALGLSEDVADAAKDFCTNAAKAKGYRVEEVVSVKPRLGDGANVVLRLSRDGQEYKFNCGYSESITEIAATKRAAEPVAVARNDRAERAERDRIERANAAAERERAEQARIAERERTEQAKVAAQREEQAKVAERNRAARVAVQERNDRAVEKTRVVTREDRTDRTASAGIPPLLWLLPLLALPLLFFFLRGRNQPVVVERVNTPATMTTERPMAKAVDASSVAKTTTATTTANGPEVMIRNKGISINIYSGPAITNAVTGTLADGEKVRLSGRYDNNWAELASGGWIDTQYLEKDPRVTA